MAASGISEPRWVRPSARWHLPETPEAALLSQLQNRLGVPRLVAAVLAHRGYSNPVEAARFLAPELDALPDPFRLRDMDRAVARISGAIALRQPILLYGDYDVDGTSSIVVLKKAIEILGGQVTFHIPHRLKEGYGMRSDIIESAAASGIRLIISVDTGIRASEVVALANSCGIDVIITDHHLPEAELPTAHAVLNPNRPDCDYPNKHLCGAGVTFKLVQALLMRSALPLARQAALLDSFLKPVAIATVADIVPLTGENRVIVRRGLSGLRNVTNLGLRALLAVAGFDPGESPSAHQVAFRLAPRINAAGRMATATDVIELFLTTDPDRARQLAEQLDVLNRERQQVESEIVEAILNQCEEQTAWQNSHAMVFSAPNWHLFVLCIVASRLVERFSRPVFVLSNATATTPGDAPGLSGSGRSIRCFHLLEALESMPQLFRKFGGHRQAAGLTLDAALLADFRQRFADYAATKITLDDLCPEYTADALASLAEINDHSVRCVLSLGPFGFGNPAPLFYATEVEVAAAPRALSSGKHFNVPLRQEGRLVIAKAWNFADRAHLLAPGAKLDILFEIQDDPYSRKRGYGSWRLNVKDVRPSMSHFEAAKAPK